MLSTVNGWIRRKRLHPRGVVIAAGGVITLVLLIRTLANIPSPEYLVAEMAAGNAAVWRNEFPAAETHYRKAVREARKSGRDDPNLPAALEALGDVYAYRCGALPPPARAHMSPPPRGRAVPVSPAVLSPLDKVKRRMRQLSAANLRRKHYHQAEACYREALALRTEILGKSNEQVIATHLHLAAFYAGAKDRAKASACCQHALSALEQHYRMQDGGQMKFLFALLDLSRETDPATAVSAATRLLAVYEHSKGSAHPATIAAMRTLAGLQRRQGNLVEYERLMRRTLTLVQATTGPQHEMTWDLIYELCHFYVEQGQYAKALPLQQRYVAYFKAQFGPNSGEYAYQLRDLAFLLDRMGRPQEAAAATTKANAILKITPRRSSGLVIW